MAVKRPARRHQEEFVTIGGTTIGGCFIGVAVGGGEEGGEVEVESEGRQPGHGGDSHPALMLLFFSPCQLWCVFFSLLFAVSPYVHCFSVQQPAKAFMPLMLVLAIALAIPLHRLAIALVTPLHHIAIALAVSLNKTPTQHLASTVAPVNTPLPCHVFFSAIALAWIPAYHSIWVPAYHSTFP